MNGCHLTETTLSSWFRVFTFERLSKSLVSVIIIEWSKPALAKYFPSTLNDTPLTSYEWGPICAKHLLILISQKVREPSVWPAQAKLFIILWLSAEVLLSSGDEVKQISFISEYIVPSIAEIYDFILTSHNLIYLSVPTLIAVDPSYDILMEYILPVWPLRFAMFFPLSLFQTFRSVSSIDMK